MGIYIEVAIGLIFTYLIISLMCTAINEIIASMLKLRARGLRNGIQEIIDDKNVQALLGSSAVLKMAGKASGFVGPSYIPSKTFVMALLDAIDPDKKTGVERTVADIKAGIDKIDSNSDLKGTLSALVRQAGDDVTAIRTEIAGWFDDMMERVSGVYKRKLQLISFLIGALLCIGLNVDSIAIGDTLWRDQTLRETVAATAAELVRDVESVDGIKKELDDLQAKLQPLPVGWYGPCPETEGAGEPGSQGDGEPEQSCFIELTGEGIVIKIMGLLLTALAVSLGAPFWFDLLKKFVNVRGAGAAPETAETKPAGGGETALSDSLGKLANAIAEKLKPQGQ